MDRVYMHHTGRADASLCHTPSPSSSQTMPIYLPAYWGSHTPHPTPPMPHPTRPHHPTARAGQALPCLPHRLPILWQLRPLPTFVNVLRLFSWDRHVYTSTDI